MIDTIVGLLEETRQQRDALAGAAEHLFSDMRIVNAGDLRVNATVSNDPIGMLANAFNFTVGRFRRFILRTQTTIDQLEVVSRQGLERSNSFISLVRTQLRDIPPSRPTTPSAALSTKAPQTQPITGPLRSGQRKTTTEAEGSFIQQVQQTQDTLLATTRDELNKRLGGTRETIEKASLSLSRLRELISTRSSSSSGAVTEKMVQSQLQELASLEQQLHRLSRDIRQMQFNSATNFTKLDNALKGLARFAGDHAELGAQEASESAPSVSEAHYQDFLRQAGAFAVEVNALSKRLTVIIQEMRTGITPFHLEGLGAVGMGESAKSTADLPPGDTPFPSTPSGNLLSAW